MVKPSKKSKPDWYKNLLIPSISFSLCYFLDVPSFQGAHIFCTFLFYLVGLFHVSDTYDWHGTVLQTSF